MMKKIVAIILGIILLIPSFAVSAFAMDTDSIVILYENDVHCAVEGYSKLSAMKKQLQESYAHVGVVSGGDFIQGTSLGVVSQGAYIVELMNLVGYDAVTLGNHEFDYRLERLEELIGQMDTKPISANFQKIGEESSYFEPYTIVSYGDVDIAYVGITTPSTITSSAPAQFKDENGEFIYTFHSTDLYQTVQASVDRAREEGADYVIAVSHIGYADDAVYGELEDIETFIRNTSGFDVVLDAHSHTVIEGKTYKDKEGNEVLLSSTGTKFQYIGKLTLSDEGFQTQLIPTESYENTDPEVDACIERIQGEYAEMGERKVAYSEVDLVINDPEGNRLVRKAETNLGDMCADALRYAMDADVGYLNGGGIRSEVTKGDVTFNDLLNIHPFNNSVVLAEITGQTLKDMMEMTMRIWPEENGSFPHLSGLKFSVNTQIPSSVVLNEVEEFIGVDGEYRVYDIQVLNRQTQSYEPLDLAKTYTIAATNFILLECGSGLKMLQSAKILKNDGMLDVEALERYVTEKLGGVIGEEYRTATTNITFTEKLPEASQTTVSQTTVAQTTVAQTTVAQTTVAQTTVTQTTASQESAEQENPQTGDAQDVGLFSLVIASCFALMIVARVYRERKTDTL